MPLVADITFIETREGWLYLAIVLDLFSRAVIGWSMSKTINGQLVKDALAMAVEHRVVESPVLTPTKVANIQRTPTTKRY